MKKLNVLYSTDSNYATHAAASIYSLLYNNKSFDEIDVYIIDDNISEDVKNKFGELVSGFPNAKLIFYPFEKLQPKLKIKETWFAMVGYARLMLSEITDEDKILYIDCDTIVNRSLEELWNTDMSGYCVAGVQDNPALYALEAVGMNRNDRYINSGVMLINLKLWKEKKVEEKIIQMIKEHNGFVLHHDQGIINGVCKNSIKILPPKYNTMSQFFSLKAKQIKSLYDINNYYTQEDLDEAVSNPVIVHYINKFFNRPWIKSCSHPMKNLYIEYLEKTPFEVELKDGKQKYTVRIRKFIFEHSPFFIYALSERILNIRRKAKAKRQ